MIDLNELQAAIDRCAFDGDVPGLSKSECTSLLAMLREAEKEAARYRYIKSVCEVIECTDGQYLDVIDGQDLDAMVDDCIKAMKEKGDE